jgi:hypothetical protein
MNILIVSFKYLWVNVFLSSLCLRAQQSIPLIWWGAGGIRAAGGERANRHGSPPEPGQARHGGDPQPGDHGGGGPLHGQHQGDPRHCHRRPQPCSHHQV